MANRRYNKLLQQTSGPYGVLSVQLHKVPIEENDITDTLSFERLTLSPTPEQVTDNLHEATHTTTKQNRNGGRKIAVKDAKKATKNDTAVPRQYMVGRIIGHVDTLQGGRCAVR